MRGSISSYYESTASAPDARRHPAESPFVLPRLIAILFAFALVGLGPPACGGSGDLERPPTPTPVSGDVTADIYDGQHPDVRVYTGSRIRWRNLGEIAHTVTAKDGSFDTNIIEEGRRSGYILFSEAGVIEYYDKLNPGMEGRVHVFDR